MPELFSRVYKFLLLKDYIQYCLTGKIAGEYSIYPFSHYFDIHKKNYWTDILEYCGVRLCQLPELVEPCTDLGPVLPAICQYTHLPESSSVNAGTLDHFAGMIGTGNLHEGLISESAGTVSSIATFVSNPAASPLKAPLYVGPFKDSYIYLPVCESGGLCLEWFKQNIITDTSYEAINTETAKRSMDNSLIFLPYITGVNPPDFNPNATGVFYGLHASHDKFDMTLAIMCGVAFLLRKNIDSFNAAGIKVDHIISTGGGARSPLWCQLKADITNVPVVIPENEESSSMGCALIGAVTNNIYPDYEAAVNHCIKMKQTFFPNPNRTIYEKKYHLFHTLYETLTPVFNEKT
jgi:sugar (pentulose or hexulose) kinase